MSIEKENTTTKEDDEEEEDFGDLFEIRKWNLVAMWSWNVKTDMCLICRFQLMEMCANCQTELKNDSCIPVWGDCGHSFHNCCMAQWLKNHKNCPMCQSMWTPIQYGS